MAFSDLEVQRSTLDAFEGATLARHQAATTLGLTESDDDMAAQAFTEVKLDLLDRTDRLFHDDTYTSRDALLDDLEAADDDNMVDRLLAIKFLEMFFGDQSIGETDGGDKAIYYEGKYNKELPQVVAALTSRLDPPNTQNVVRFRRF